jgi:hypothetical protein
VFLTDIRLNPVAIRTSGRTRGIFKNHLLFWASRALDRRGIFFQAPKFNVIRHDNDHGEVDQQQQGTGHSRLLRLQLCLSIFAFIELRSSALCNVFTPAQ